jgi:hypothetical protein
MEYYVTTLTNAFKNLAPYVAFLVGGYFIFIKMPFLFLKKSMDDQKKKLHEENKGFEVTKEEKYTVDDYLAFQQKLKLMNGGQEKSGASKKEEPRQERKTQQRSEQKREQRSEQKKEQKTEQKREAPKRPAEPADQSPEEIFNLRPGQAITKSELKKRYFELLKQNHPDRVASMGQDFKKLAEKNTKEINKAYDRLKNKAS